jgi:hypothetical protein
MGWDRDGRYYTRSRKVNGRVVREYVGKGAIAEMAALLDADHRAQREEQKAARREEQSRLEAQDAEVSALDQAADLLTRAALVAAGYRLHNRGEWRKRRVQSNKT